MDRVWHVALACRVRAAGDLVTIRRQSRTDRERLPSSPIVGWEQNNVVIVDVVSNL